MDPETLEAVNKLTQSIAGLQDHIKQLDESRETLRRTSPPIGSVVFLAGIESPLGYLPCDGQAVSRIAFANLFAVIGTAWGEGDGESTFNLPDLRGEFLRIFDTGRGVDPQRVLGQRQSYASSRSADRPLLA